MGVRGPIWDSMFRGGMAVSGIAHQFFPSAWNTAEADFKNRPRVTTKVIRVCSAKTSSVPDVNEDAQVRSNGCNWYFRVPQALHTADANLQRSLRLRKGGETNDGSVPDEVFAEDNSIASAQAVTAAAALSILERPLPFPNTRTLIPKLGVFFSVTYIPTSAAQLVH
jgi:hypothetical protein